MEARASRRQRFAAALIRRWRLICWYAPPNRLPRGWQWMISSYAKSLSRAKCYMKPITLEWIDKAEGDWFSAQREARARKHPNYDAACFHAQQCAEKYLKARLQKAGLAFKKTHDLVNLLNLILPVE